MPAIEHNKEGIVPAAATLPEDEEVESKTYHSRFPGSNYIDAVGRVHEFRGNGNLVTASKNLQTALNKIADRPGSVIYTTDAPIITAAEVKPVDEIKERAADVIRQIKVQQAAQTGG